MNNTQIKSTLTEKQIMLVDSDFEKVEKSKGIAYAMWFFTSVLGGQRYYAGDIGQGVAMTFTLGGFGIWALIDLFKIGKRIEEVNSEKELDIIHRIKATT